MSKMPVYDLGASITYQHVQIPTYDNQGSPSPTYQHVCGMGADAPQAHHHHERTPQALELLLQHGHQTRGTVMSTSRSHSAQKAPKQHSGDFISVGGNDSRLTSPKKDMTLEKSSSSSSGGRGPGGGRLGGGARAREPSLDRLRCCKARHVARGGSDQTPTVVLTSDGGAQWS
jgi:hypothetical protein